MNRDLPIYKRYDKLGPNVVNSLKSRHFDAYYVKTKEEALEKILELIPKEDTVSWGGSQTLAELNVQNTLKEKAYKVIDRDLGKTREEKLDLMRKALLSDTYLMSSNAISEDGQLFNIDGNGNRVAALCFGPKSVIVVAGMNKIVKNIEDAYVRSRTIAAPTNAQRFEGIKTPCYINGSCGDCKSTDSICASMVTTRISRPAKKIKVILVGENLGM